jgi:hypothetical protein
MKIVPSNNIDLSNSFKIEKEPEYIDCRRHFEAFCSLYKRLEELFNNGKKDCEESRKIVGVMQFHFKKLNRQMYIYLGKFQGRLREIGFVTEEEQFIQAENNGETGISGNFDFAKLVHHRERIQFPGEQVGYIFNYNEHSIPLEHIDGKELQELKRKTIENLKFEEACFRDPTLINKVRAKYRQPRRWGLPDDQKDW